MGRPRKPLPNNFYENYKRWKNGEITSTVAAEKCGLTRGTFRNRAAQVALLKQ